MRRKNFTEAQWCVTRLVPQLKMANAMKAAKADVQLTPNQPIESERIAQAMLPYFRKLLKLRLQGLK